MPAPSYGEWVDDVDDALFTRAWLEENRVERSPEPADVTRIVVALDPADGSGGAGAEQALCAACITHRGHVYILRSSGERSSPLQWLKRAIRVAQALGATIIVEDTGYGRPLMELLEQAMTEAGRVPYQAVHAQQSKRLRAQDAAILAETGKLHLVGRQHDLLEDQMCTWVEGEKSPDRFDAMAHAVRELLKSGGGGEVAGRAVPYTVRRVEGGAVPWEGDPVGGLFASAEGTRVLQAERQLDPQLAWLGLTRWLT